MTMLKPLYNTVTFTDVYNNVDTFLEDMGNGGIPIEVKVENLTTLFYLLYAKYGNNPIANNDINQWKYKLLSVIFQYGPTWQRKLEIQKTLRNLDESELTTGGKAIYNNAANPDSAPSTSTLEELTYINSQSTSNFKKGKMDAYANLWALLDTNLTKEFIDKFKPLFKTFVKPENPLLYTDSEDEDSPSEVVALY